MKTLFLVICGVLLAGQTFSQTYFQDLVLTGDLAKKRALYQANKVRSVRMNSFDNRDQPIENFSSNQSVNNNFTEIKTVTRDPLNGVSTSTSSFDQKGQLVRSVDSSENNKVVVSYTYDASGKLNTVNSQSTSPGNYINREQHYWYYDANGRPQRMVKVKNSTDTTKIEFVLDEKGNVNEEKGRINGVLQPGIYYYYDTDSRLTDVVRYNTRAKRMLPDYIFEYDENGRLRTMLTPMQNMGDYQKWYYAYDEKGLKQKDECFSKERVLIGRIEYLYQY
jgi:hypothetical protein